ncbi:acyl-CoA dehydrogenase family protein [Wenzhouxiangella marina]|uniref:Acyl-CoA dehydrogenase domain-containing protein n=1 Tax=Wenzhouxiangella marina TaxID=1579979 RepID=A0A0K0XX65_9GAMM|nr:acyl-CoA dehydrogenase family protein [Wenzhouxiangella marina]AKS42289.1 Acyl-CoA dehydrogenase domain-containing protein [Wenzhouxiangella marina]MBB6085938.1 acyl-CoA dehydrogenase [Wenzhouxiangella marina]
MDLTPTERAQELRRQLGAFLHKRVLPAEIEWKAAMAELADPWQELPVIRELKAEAREAGLWNLFLPDAELGQGLSNLDYAPLAEQMGRSLIAPEVFNCNAPDTGNMEVLYHYGSEAQKAQWLKPLLAGEIRSAFCMTEPDVASSDATNMQATARIEGDEVVLNGRKWWSTGIGHPNCRVVIFMGLTDPEADRHQRHSMVLVPLDTPGVKVERMLTAMGMLDAPYGHGEVSFDEVRLPASAIIAGPGRGFEIAQGRLGPGRIHHCMRLIGLAELALELACKRALSRTAFGRPLAKLGGNAERIAQARIAIEQARLLVLKAAWCLDHKGVARSMSEISQIKVAVPSMAQDVVDMAMQLHGGAGLSEDLPLAAAWTAARALRLADGPDEVHRGLIARMELAKYRDA